MVGGANNVLFVWMRYEIGVAETAASESDDFSFDVMLVEDFYLTRETEDHLFIWGT